MRKFFEAATLAIVIFCSVPGARGQTDGELRVAVANFGREVLDMGLTSTQDLQYTGHIHDPLISGDEQGQLSSARGLAISWTMSADAKTLTLALRQGVKWHDGKPFTADDVVFTLGERLSAPDAICTFCRFMRNGIEKIETPDSATVIIRLRTPDVTFPSLLSSRDGDIRMLARHNYRKIEGGYELVGPPIGTGPWRFEAFERGVEMRLRANRDYWDRSRVPAFETMRILPRAQASTRLAMVRSGEVDMAFIDPRQAPDAKLAGLKLMMLEGSSINLLTMLGCWQQQMTCHDRIFREAIASAIDVQTIVKRYYPEGSAKPIASSLWTEAALGFDPALKPYSYDPKRARELLKSINYDGRKVRLWSVPTNSNPEAPEIMQLVEGYLRAAGFQTEITPMEFGAFRPRYANDPQNFETSFAAHLFVDAPGSRPVVLSNLATSFISKKAGGNLQGVANLQKYDDVYRQLQTITNLDDLATRLRDVNRMAYDDYVVVPLAVRAVVAAGGPRVGTWSPGRYGFAWNLETVTRAN